MTQAVDGITSSLDQLNARIVELERRVASLESTSKRSPTHSAAPSLSQQTIPTAAAQRPAGREFSPTTSGGAIPVFGRAVLGIAGAYLLRAIAESGSVAPFPVLLLAIVYASLWLAWAVRTYSTDGVASITYALTSVLILSPLLWESTVRFLVLPPSVAGLILVGYAALMLALTRRRDLICIPWIVILCVVNTALALIVATHALVPLIVTLLVVSFGLELQTCLVSPNTIRAVPALAADLALLLLVDIMTSSDGVPEGYAPTSPAVITILCLAPLAILGISVAIRGFRSRQPITIFDMTQGVLALVIATLGALRATHNASAPLLGALYLLVAAACYWGMLSLFAGQNYTRNRIVSAIWSIGLLLLGCILLFPPAVQVLCFCLLAMGAAILYRRTNKFSLGIHVSVLLAAAAVVSALPVFIVDALAGTIPAVWNWSIGLITIGSALSYLIGSRATSAADSHPALWTFPALLVSFAVDSLIVTAIVGILSGEIGFAASRLSVVRTLVNCALALTLAFFGSKWKRIELGWIAYAAVGFGTLKLVFEDLRYGNATSLVFSLLFYGLILILLPRLKQRHSNSDQLEMADS